MSPLRLSDSIAVYSRHAQMEGAVDLCSGAWPASAAPVVSMSFRNSTAADVADYPPARGLPELRAAIAALYSDRRVADDQVTVASGATGALLLLLETRRQRGGEVVAAEPGYALSSAVVSAMGLGYRRVAAWAPPRRGSGWHFDPDTLLAAVGPGTAAILLADPDNPTGGVLSPEDWQRLIDGARRHDCPIIVDRVYEHYALDSCPVPTADLRESGVIVVSSISKLLHAAGMRIGWVLSDPALGEGLGQASALLLGGVAAPAQRAAAEALLRLPGDGLIRERLRAQHMCRKLRSTLADAAIDPWPVQGGLFLDVPASRLGAGQSHAAWQALLARGLGGVPSRAFRETPERPEEAFVRLSFARDEGMLAQVAARLGVPHATRTGG